MGGAKDRGLIEAGFAQMCGIGADTALAIRNLGLVIPRDTLGPGI